MIVSLSWSLAHLIAGGFQHGLYRTIFLSIGVIAGAQLGAQLSQRIAGPIINRIMAGGLILIGVRLILHAFEI